MKLYRIKNNNYEEKQVVAKDMGEALDKYRRYLHEHINVEFSDEEIFQEIESCTFVRVYEDDGFIK